MPPLIVKANFTGLPAVGFAGEMQKSTKSGCGATDTGLLALATTPLLWVTVKSTQNVPFTGKLCVNVLQLVHNRRRLGDTHVVHVPY